LEGALAYVRPGARAGGLSLTAGTNCAPTASAATIKPNLFVVALTTVLLTIHAAISDK
jgi:hypothetical protein